MRLYDKAFIIKVQDDGGLPLTDYLAKVQELNGKVGICISYKFSGDRLLLALRVEDRIVVVPDSEVRFHPDVMKALEEDLKAVIEFNKRYPDDIKGHEFTSD